MELAAFLQRRVDSLGGSWLACRDILLVGAQLAQTSRELANKHGEITRELMGRFPGTRNFLRLQRSLNHVGQGLVYQRAIARRAITGPMPRDVFLSVMGRGKWRQSKSLLITYGLWNPAIPYVAS